ncbi:ABC transporter substrate-binding protein [Candidatus Bathyarchaeota archaeon]|nr:ABC transporter substrate-binding protein [Candidatus Bathyarchaeota archaeon]MBS7631154.1 ABC transporter substrate-binding protein [Candidatus Bathyarchaeota archaeon]
MEQKSLTLVIVMLVVGLAIGGGLGYVMAPTKEVVKEVQVTVTKNPLKDATLKIGDIVASTAGLETEKPLIDKIMVPDLNEYVSALGFGMKVQILLDDAQSQPSIHLEKVQSFKSQGITQIMGGRWSSQAQGSISYMNENNMILVSSSSTSPLLKQKDNLFRICPTDLVQAPANAEMMKTWGIKGVIIFMRIDPWGEGLYQVIVPALQERGIELIDAIKYAPETTDFSSYLQKLEDDVKAGVAKYGDKKYVAVQIFSFDEQITFLTAAESYPTIKDIIWFSTESGGRDQRYINEIGEPLVAKRMFSSYMGVAETSWKFINLDRRFLAETAQTAGFYTGTTHDGLWLMVLSTLEAGSTDAKDVIPIFINVAANYFGATGWCDLDEFGDRKAQVFDIWGYYKDTDGTVKFRKYGEYDGRVIQVKWDDAALAAVGLQRPALG